MQLFLSMVKSPIFLNQFPFSVFHFLKWFLITHRLVVLYKYMLKCFSVYFYFFIFIFFDNDPGHKIWMELFANKWFTQIQKIRVFWKPQILTILEPSTYYLYWTILGHFIVINAWKTWLTKTARFFFENRRKYWYGWRLQNRKYLRFSRDPDFLNLGKCFAGIKFEWGIQILCRDALSKKN